MNATEYKIIDKSRIDKIVFKNLLFWTIGGFMTLLIGVYGLWATYSYHLISIINAFKDPIEKGIGYFGIAVIFIVLGVGVYAIIYGIRDFISRYRFAGKIILDNDKIIAVSLNESEKTYKFNEFLKDVKVYVNMAKVPYVMGYSNFYKFLSVGIKEINNKFEETKNIKPKKENIIDIVINKKGVSGRWFELIISPEVMGGKEKVIEMLEDWKEKFEEYLKRSGKYEEMMENTGEVRNKR